MWTLGLVESNVILLFFRDRENTKIIIFHINISLKLGDNSLLVVVEHITTVNDNDVHGSSPFNSSFRRFSKR